jgi:hypothetical protein
MSPPTAFFLGIFCGLMIVTITAWWAVTWFRDEPTRGLAACSVLLRVFSESTGYKSALVALGDDVAVVPFEQMARAIEKGSLLGSAPVRVSRSDRPPPLSPRDPPREEPPDGHA